MKRIGNLYKNIYKMQNIIDAYKEVCKNTKNKRKVYNYKQYKCVYITRIHEVLEKNNIR